MHLQNSLMQHQFFDRGELGRNASDGQIRIDAFDHFPHGEKESIGISAGSDLERDSTPKRRLLIGTVKKRFGVVPKPRIFGIRNGPDDLDFSEA